MVLTCRQCSRVNPVGALYCYHDGVALDSQGRQSGPLDVGKQNFAAPFVFPSGQTCRNFDQLGLACNRCWNEARELLRDGFLAGFLGGLGRADLAVAAREAAKHPDPDQGLDDLLAKFPSEQMQRPKLKVSPSEINLGTVAVGKDIQTAVQLTNEGMRLLRGSAVVRNCEWLHLGEAGAIKLFQFTDDLRLPVQVHGKALRASTRPLEGNILVDTNGGTETIRVRALVPVTPFAEGTLAGSRTPREAATRAKAAPRDAAPLFESGAVARWYEANGWTYPVLGPPSTGLGAVQQFFEALGLVQPPRVDISDTAIRLNGNVGERLQASVKVTAQQPRPVYAHATSDQPWLTIGKVTLAGTTASLLLIIEAVPDQPGETLEATVKVTANGQQRLSVTVTLGIAGTPRPRPAGTIIPEPDGIPVLENLDDDDLVTAIPIDADSETPSGLPLFARIAPDSWPRWMHATPLIVVCLLLLGFIVRDFFATGSSPVPPDLIDEFGPPDPNPYIGVLFHDRGDALIEQPSQRFGLVMLREKDPKDPRKLKKLTYDELGRSNNVCLVIDGKEYLFGHNRPGHAPGEWEGRPRSLGTDVQSGEERIGERCTWRLNEGKVAVTQRVEVIVGPHTGRKDTCLVRYSLTNRDSKAHTVGIRFLLDTYIGTDDGVPFTIPGKKNLCDTFQRFDRADRVPDFIQALERQDLSDPGTIAHLQLRLGSKIESPSRLTLGCWPDHQLAKDGKAPNALEQLTGWEVPVLPMNTLSPGNSAVTMYWNPRTLPAGATREVGFSYGLGTIATEGSARGKLALTAGGSFRPGGEFTVTAYVSSPAHGETLTLELPDGFTLLDGDETQKVPALAAGAGRRTSPVTWKVNSPIRAGRYLLKVKSSNGVSQTQRVIIQPNRLFN